MDEVVAEEVVVVEDEVRFAGSFTAVGEDELRALAPEGVGDVLRRVPGLHVAAEDGAGLFVNVGVRGLAPARSAKVLVLEDGVPIAPGPYGHPELYWVPPVGRLERIEVVRGSGSIRFGPQTIGGVINLRTPSVPGAPVAEVEGRLGGFGLGVVRAAGGNGDGGSGWRVDAEHRRFTGARGIDLVATDVAAKVGVDVGRGAATAKVSWADESARPSYLGLTTDQFADDPTLNLTTADHFHLTRVAAHAELHSPVGATARLRSTLYAQQVIRAWARQDYERSDDGATITLLDANNQRDRLYAFAGLEEELRVTPALAGEDRLALRFGARLHHEHERQRQLAGATAAAISGALTDDDLLTGDALAGWAEAELDVTERIRVTGGARVEALRSQRQTLLPAETTGHARFAEILPGLGASWTPWRPLSLWAGVHRGWAPPSTTDAITGDGTVLALSAERSWNTEVGARVVDAAARFEVTGFALVFQNQLTPPSEAGVAADVDFVNGDPTRHLGVETEARLDVLHAFAAPWALAPFVRYSYVDARYTGGVFAGNVLPYAPRHLGSAGVTLSRGRAVELLLVATHVGAHYADGANTVAASVDGTNGRIDAWTTVDATASAAIRVAGGRELRLQVAAKNLTDEVYVASRAPAGIQPQGFRSWEVALSGAW